MISVPVETGLSNEYRRAVPYIEAVGLFGRKEEFEKIDTGLDRDLHRSNGCGGFEVPRRNRLSEANGPGQAAKRQPSVSG
jgi:hypothetical protein